MVVEGNLNMCRITIILCLFFSGFFVPLFSQGETVGNPADPSFARPSMVFLYGLDSMYCVNDLPVALFAEPLGGTFSGPIRQDGIFTPSKAGVGVHTLKYVYHSPEGWSDSASVVVEVSDMPFSINMGPDCEVYMGNTALLETGRNELTTGQWTVVSGFGTFLTPDSTDTYVTDLPDGSSVFRYTLYNGACSRSNTIEVNVVPFPTKRGFSPNEDGINDFFVIRSLELYPETSLQVFNRWGHMVYESSDYQNEWDGKNMTGEDLPDDTYYYILALQNGDEYKGYVILKR